MDLLSAIGTGIVGKIAEYTVEPVGRQVGYVIHCKSNLANLQARVEELRAARWGIDNEVVEAQRKGEKIDPGVQYWLTKVDEITGRTDEFLKDESQAKLKCLHGFCPNLSRKSTKLVQEVVDLYEIKNNIFQSFMWYSPERGMELIYRRVPGL